MICEESVQAIACRKGNIYIECVKTKHIMCYYKIFQHKMLSALLGNRVNRDIFKTYLTKNIHNKNFQQNLSSISVLVCGRYENFKWSKNK